MGEAHIKELNEFIVGAMAAVSGLSPNPATIFRAVKETHILEDQTPDYESLVTQLRSPEHIVKAAYKLHGKWTFRIVACRTSEQLADARRKRQLITLSDLAQRDPSNTVVFVAGLP